MTRRIGLLTLFGLFALAPAVAEAQRYGRRGGYVNTPFGPVNMQTMQAAGGDPFSALQMQQQMMMMQQQKQMMQYQQQMQKQAQQQQKNQPSMTNQSQMYPTGSNVTSVSKKKKKTYTPSGTTAKADSKKADAKKDETKKDDPGKTTKAESGKTTTSAKTGSKP